MRSIIQIVEPEGLLKSSTPTLVHCCYHVAFQEVIVEKTFGFCNPLMCASPTTYIVQPKWLLEPNLHSFTGIHTTLSLQCVRKMQTGLELSDFSKSDKKFRLIHLALLCFQICVSLDFFVPSTIPIWGAGGQGRWRYFNSFQFWPFFFFFSSTMSSTTSTWHSWVTRKGWCHSLFAALVAQSSLRATSWGEIRCVLHHEVRFVACYIMRWDKLKIEDI